MPMWLGEVIVSAMLIIMAVIAYVLSGGIAGTVNPADIGPAAFPRLTLIAIMLIGTFQIITSLRGRKKGKPSAGVPPKNKTLALIAMFVLLFLYGQALTIVGFYIASGVFIVALMLLMGNRRWIQLISAPIGFNLFVYVVFVMLLNIRLP